MLFTLESTCFCKLEVSPTFTSFNTAGPTRSTPAATPEKGDFARIKLHLKVKLAKRTDPKIIAISDMKRSFKFIFKKIDCSVTRQLIHSVTDNQKEKWLYLVVPPLQLHLPAVSLTM